MSSKKGYFFSNLHKNEKGNIRMKIGLPAGIGDASWIVSKLINAPEWNELEIEISSG